MPALESKEPTGFEEDEDDLFDQDGREWLRQSNAVDDEEIEDFISDSSNQDVNITHNSFSNVEGLEVVENMALIGATTSLMLLGIGLNAQQLFYTIAGLGFSLMFTIGYYDVKNIIKNKSNR